MLSKKNRMDRNLYTEVFNRGRAIHTPLLFCKYKKDVSKKRFSAVIAKKILHQAHDRNSLRRFVYDVIQPEIDNMAPASVIFILKKTFLESNKVQLKKEIKETLSKLS